MVEQFTAWTPGLAHHREEELGQGAEVFFLNPISPTLQLCQVLLSFLIIPYTTCLTSPNHIVSYPSYLQHPFILFKHLPKLCS